MKSGTGHDPHEAFLRVWSEVIVPKDSKSKSSLKIEVDGCPRYSTTQTENTCALKVAKLSAMLQHRPPEKRHICRRESVGTIRHLSTKVFRLQQLVKRGVVTVGACTHPRRPGDQIHYLTTDSNS